MNMAKKIFLISLALLILCSFISSKENEQKGNKEEEIPQLHYEIVVTATRLETSSREIASSITVITKQEVEQMRKATILEILADALGVGIVQNGGMGGASSLFLRGANSEHTLIMLDGVELNDPMAPSRSADTTHLLADSIERIEILQGPQSTLYGSDALGGVINIITNKGQEQVTGFVQAFGGSYATLNSSVHINGGIDKFFFSLGTSYLKTKGFSAAGDAYDGNSEKDGYQNFTLSGRFVYSPINNLDFDLIVRRINTKTDIDNFGGAFGDDPNNVQDYDAFFIKGQIRSLLLNNRWEQKLEISFVDHNRTHENPVDEIHPFESDASEFKSTMWKLDWQHNIFFHEKNTLTFGIDHQLEKGKSEYVSESLMGIFSSLFPLRKAHTSGVYIQDYLKIAGRFFATLGARLDHHNQTGTALTYRIAPAYIIQGTGTKLRTTYGTGFKSPSLYQLYAPGNSWGPIGNTGLKPEESKAWELGLEQSLFREKVLLEMTYFNSSYKNLIDFDFLKGYINIGRAFSNGFELALKAKPTDIIYISASYASTVAKDKDTGDYLLRRPKEKFFASLNYHFLFFNDTATTEIYTGEREDMDFSTWPSSRTTLASYTLLNIVLAFSISESFQVFGRLDNALDEKYEVIKGYGAPGFSFYGGIKLAF
jgi:vitamin B12 transporter